jgi:hypothetical protein
MPVVYFRVDGYPPFNISQHLLMEALENLVLWLKAIEKIQLIPKEGHIT